MKIPSLLFTSLVAVSSSHAANLIVNNGNFSGDFNGWTVVETTGEADSLYTEPASGSAAGQGNVALFKDGTGSTSNLYLQQSISANNAGVFANTYSTYTLTLDMGWRNDLSDRNDASFRFSLFNTTDNTELAFQDVNFAVRSVGQSDVYQLTQDDASFVLSYDNNNPAYVGDTIEFRIARTDADTTADPDNYLSTAWVDDVRLAAVPEPSSFGMVMVSALAGVCVRRRGRK